MASKPFMFGMSRSRMITSGEVASQMSTAWMPSAASPTTLMPNWRSWSLSSSRMSSSSSAMTTSMIVGCVHDALGKSQPGHELPSCWLT